MYAAGGVLALETGGVSVAIAVEGGAVASLVMAHGTSVTAISIKNLNKDIGSYKEAKGEAKAKGDFKIDKQRKRTLGNGQAQNK